MDKRRNCTENTSLYQETVIVFIMLLSVRGKMSECVKDEMSFKNDVLSKITVDATCGEKKRVTLKKKTTLPE